MFKKDKKIIINEGRAITNGKLTYGGFPRMLNENNNIPGAGPQNLEPNDANKNGVNDGLESDALADQRLDIELDLEDGIDLDDLLVDPEEEYEDKVILDPRSDEYVMDTIQSLGGYGEDELEEMTDDQLLDLFDNLRNNKK